MKENMWKHGKRLLRQQKRRTLWHRAVGALSCLVVFCTVYALILPAITMEKTVYCGLEEHQHGESCYTRRLICEQPTEEIIPGHTHTEECYRHEKLLICGLEETEEHIHTEDCYTEVDSLICGQEEQPETVTVIHEHTDECYETVLTCALEEHTHSFACYSDHDADLETAAEQESGLMELTGDSGDESGCDAVSGGGIESYGVLPEEEPAGEPLGEAAEEDEKAAESAQENEEESAETNEPLTLTAEGEDYMVNVSYTEEAEIPKGAVLEVREYAADSEVYQARFDEANAALLEQDGSCVRRARFFDISILDGETKIEPGDTVKVEISQLYEPEEIQDDIVIVHTDQEGTEIISEVEVIREENGFVTAGFETGSFSDYGMISSGQSATIGVGDTVTLSGTSGNRNNWSAAPEGCVTLETSGSNAAVVTGTAAGTVVVTHTYNNKGASESFTVIVTAEEEADAEKEALGAGYTVTVRGNKKVLADDVTLHVEDYPDSEADYRSYYDALVEDLSKAASTSVSDDSFAFLWMYHIYLTKEGQEGEYIPEENVNLQVTLTYDTAPDNWDKINWVGHYKKSNGTVSGAEVSDDSSSSIGVKQIRVSGNSLTFHIQSFSVFPVAALTVETGGGSSGGGTTAPADGSILTTEQLSWIGSSGSNEWQIVDGEYAGNGGTDKTTSSDEKVRVQKNVIPTGVENEFLVYLSIDTKQLFADYFASAEYKATTSNNYHDSALGTVVTAMTGNEKVDVVGASTRYTNHASFTILSSAGELLADNITLYWSQANNVTFYLVVNDGAEEKYVLTGVKVEKNGQEVIMLSEEAERLIMSNIAQMAHLDRVTDVMGEYVEFLSVVSGDYDTAPVYDGDTRTLTWIPAIKANPEIDKVKSEESKEVTWTDHDGNVRTETVYQYTSWALNVSELVYRVKLDVSRDGFQSAAANMESKVGDGESYQVNQSAVLTYGGESEITFPVPYVRGLLYDVQFEKIDKDDRTEKLSGAGFELKGVSGDASGKTYPVTEVKDADGKGTGTYRAVDLPWGMYELTEAKPPVGYRVSKDDPGPWEIGGSYTEDRTLAQDSAKETNLLFERTGGSDTVWQIENERIIYVDLIKTDMGYEPLSGAEFSLYDTDPGAGDAVPMTGYERMVSAEDGVIADNLEVEDQKTYYLVEIRAPDGYDLPADPVITLKVNRENTTTSGPIAVSGGAGEVKKTEEKQLIDDVETTVWVIEIPNNPGVELPETGGTGTLPYTFGGAGLMLAFLLMYGCSLRYRRERRSENL